MMLTQQFRQQGPWGWKEENLHQEMLAPQYVQILSRKANQTPQKHNSLEKQGFKIILKKNF